MREKLSNEQKHERIYCAFTHWRIAAFLAALSAMEVFVTWRGLDKPDSLPPDAFAIAFYILATVVLVPVFMGVLRCFSERFVVGVVALVLAKAVAFWFAPTLFYPLRALIERCFVVLWAAAFLVSLNMVVRAVRDPYIGPEYSETARAKRGFVIMSAFIVVLFVIGMLMYFVP